MLQDAERPFYFAFEANIVRSLAVNIVEEQEAIVTMEEDRLPSCIRGKAAISAGGEYAWRKDDFEDVIQAARTVGLAPIGGQAQFQFPDGICEAYWLCYSAPSQGADEPWATYVERSVQVVHTQFNQLYATTDFAHEAMHWEWIRQKVQADGINPLDYLWFVLYFAADAPQTQA